MSTSSEIADLAKKIRATVDPTDAQKRKFKVVKNGKHQKVLRGNGAVLTDPTAGGPVILSGSPGDARWREMKVNQLIRLGVFKTDPYKATRAGEDGGDPDDYRSDQEKAKDAEKERRQDQLRARSAGLQERTKAVRAQMEGTIAKLGGWSRGGSGVKVPDFINVLQFWAKRADLLHLFPTMSGGGGYPVPATQWTTAVNNLKAPDATLGEKWLPLFERFSLWLEDEGRDSDGIPDPAESALVYMDLFREVKGIPISSSERGESETSSTLAPSHVRVIFEYPRVALEALFFMSRGADAQDQDRILDLAEEIAELASTNEERKSR